ncbi:MAG: hypothetical protein JKY53_15015 [Flavobacteriales bacterium]|nr:hypothetical protein [Flavobacteriales bacterium]
MATTLKQLGQLRPTNTTAATIYSPGANTETIVKSIVVCNTTASAVKYRIFWDDNGTTYDETTALYFDVNLPGNTTDTHELNITMNDSTGNIAVRTDTNNAINFTCSGVEIT